MENLREGFRFRPTDAEGLTFLLRFISGKMMNDSGFITTNIDTYGKQEPWEIYTHGVPCGNDDGDCSDQYRFFITKLKKKSDSMYHRNVGNKGSWRQQHKGKAVRKNGGPVIGYKKNMSYVNKGYNQKNGNWLMKEYELSSAILEKFEDDCRHFVLCAIKKRTSKATKVLNNVPEETGSSNICRNLELRKTPVFLKFQESSVESTSTSNYDAGKYNIQGNLVLGGDSVNFTQNNSVPGLDALELHQLVKKNYMHEDRGMNIVVEPLLDPNTFEATLMYNFDHQYVPGLEALGVMLPDLHDEDDVNIISEPAEGPYTSDATTSMLNFDHEYVPADFGPWDILLDSDDIVQILHGT